MSVEVANIVTSIIIVVLAGLCAALIMANWNGKQ